MTSLETPTPLPALVSLAVIGRRRTSALDLLQKLEPPGAVFPHCIRVRDFVLDLLILSHNLLDPLVLAANNVLQTTLEIRVSESQVHRLALRIHSIRIEVRVHLEAPSVPPEIHSEALLVCLSLLPLPGTHCTFLGVVPAKMPAGHRSHVALWAGPLMGHRERLINLTPLVLGIIEIALEHLAQYFLNLHLAVLLLVADEHRLQHLDELIGIDHAVVVIVDGCKDHVDVINWVGQLHPQLLPDGNCQLLLVDDPVPIDVHLSECIHHVLANSIGSDRPG
mmetsp:Transcript_14847/g.23102  ORF Transcript_14847/g.23102 Transcript_14847/m.23102 type:complete len:279 (-) Transcript_14847:202-1038(-)